MARESLQSIDFKVLSRIYGSKRGAVFTANRFLDLGSRDAVDKTLSRLAAKGTIRRLARGLYDYPRQHPRLGLLAPDIEMVAKALAGKDNIRIQPSGAYAANLLGLTEQVPAKAVFLTDGISRTVRLDAQTIQLRRTTPRNMATAGKLSGLVIQGLRELGKDQVTAEHIAHLKRTLPAEKRRELLKDLRHAPTWIQPILRELAED